MGKVITVASGKGGTGKTSTVAAVSSCLAVLGFKTLCIDFDAGLKCLDLSLGMADFAVADYMDVTKGRLDLMEACSESPRIKKLFFLSAPSEANQNEQDKNALKKMFDEIREEFDFCLVDSPSGIGTGFKQANSCTDTTIIVTLGELPAMRDAHQAASAARDLGVGNLRLLVNRVLPQNIRRLRSTIDDVIDTVGVQLIGVIPEDPAVFRALHANTPLVLYRRRRAAYDFLDVARRLSGEDIPLRQR